MQNMEYRRFDITIISADDLQKVKLMFKMDVYVALSIVGDWKSKRIKTHIDKCGGTTPKWNHRMTFAVAEDELVKPINLSILFQLRSDRVLGNRDIGFVAVPIQELLAGDTSVECAVEYRVRKPSEKFKGILKFSYKFDEKFTTPLAPEKVHVPVVAYPPHVGAGTVGAPFTVVGLPYSPYPPPRPAGPRHGHTSNDNDFWCGLLVGELLAACLSS